tara:strand:- start:84 stop:548 length:465 start_codon:yes stop_codon:yes gene_type:complete
MSNDIVISNDNENNDDFYRILRQKIEKWLSSEEGENYRWARYISIAPDLLHLLCKLVIHKDVSNQDKAKLGAALVYFISPIDLIPEGAVGPIGYIDDIAFAAHVLNHVIKNNSEIVVQQWAGDENILKLVKDILEVADEMLGSGLWEKIKGMLN